MLAWLGELAPAPMTLEEHFRLTFAELTDRIRGEVSRLSAAAVDELIAAAEREAEVRAETALAMHADQPTAPDSPSDRQAPEAAERLLDAIRALDRGASLSDILDTLATCAGAEVARAAVLIVRGDSLRGWRLIGFDADLAGARDLELPLAQSGPIAAAVRTRCQASARDSAPAFARLPSGRECLALPLVVAGEVVAVLYADEGAGDAQAQHVDAGRASTLEVVVRHAARCLEAITAFRAAQAATGAPGSPVRAMSAVVAEGPGGADIDRGSAPGLTGA